MEDGSSKGAAFNVRVISDSPAYALAAKAVLEQAQINSSSWPFAKDVIVYAAGGAKAFAGVMFAGGKAGEVTGEEGGEEEGREGGQVLMSMQNGGEEVQRQASIRSSFYQ